MSKKDEFDYESEEVKKRNWKFFKYTSRKLRIYRRYDLKIDEKTLNSILHTILSEKPVDETYVGEEVKNLENSFDKVIRVSYLRDNLTKESRACWTQ